MTDNPVADRYATALFELAKREGRIDETLAQLQELGELLRRHADFRQFLLNPDVDAPDKLRVLGRVISELSAEMRAFIQVVVAMDRAEALGAMVEAFRELVDQERRRVRVQVRSARPLPAALRQRLIQRLEALEHRRVELTEAVAPELIGGVQILFDRQIIDGSLQTRLAELRQQLKQVKVH